METISQDELRAKLDRRDDFKLVMVYHEVVFQSRHIPGSINVPDPRDVLTTLKPEEEIVLYCSDAGCPSSKYAYRLLERAGYKNICRYSGGISDWEAAGLPMEGDLDR